MWSGNVDQKCAKPFSPWGADENIAGNTPKVRWVVDKQFFQYRPSPFKLSMKGVNEIVGISLPVRDCPKPSAMIKTKFGGSPSSVLFK